MALPGDIRVAVEEQYCSYRQHETDIPAVKELCGETDSFGSEWIGMCQTCYDEHKAKPVAPKIGECNRCHTGGVEVHHRRDPDEGTHGPVYLMCNPCYNRLIEYFTGGCEVPEE